MRKSHRFPDIKYYTIFRNVSLKIYVKVTMYNIRNGAVRWRIPDFLSDGNSYLRDIRKNIKMSKVLILNMEVEVKE